MGILSVFIAGVLLGIFPLLLKYLHKNLKFTWEVIWTIYSIVGFLIYPWAMVYLFFPLEIIPSVLGLTVTASVLFFGFIWGFGNSLFGFTIPIIGASTASVINTSIVLSIGTMTPIILGNRAVLSQWSGVLIIIGVLVMLSSLVAAYFAAVRKEREQNLSASAEFTSHSIDKKKLKLGLFICMISGLFAAQLNIGFYLSNEIVENALAHHVSSNAANYLVWAISMTGAAVASLLISSFMLYKNKTTKAFLPTKTHRPSNALVPANGFALYLISSLMGIIQLSAFLLYGVGSNNLGEFGVSVGFAIFSATAICVNQIVGFLQGDWENTSNKTKSIMYLAILLIIAGIIQLSSRVF